MRCIIFYEHIVRDFAMCASIKDRMEKSGSADLTVDLFSITFEFAYAIDSLKHNPADLVVLPWMRAASPSEHLTPFFISNPNVKFLILNQEQIGSPCSFALLLPYDDFARCGVFHCTWAEGYALQLEQAGVPSENIFITGNAKLQASGTEVPSRLDLAGRYALDNTKKWILYAESRNVSVFFNDNFIRQQRTCGLSGEDIEQNRAYFVESYEASMKQLSSLPDSFFEQFEIIYRLHPGMADKIEFSSKVKKINELPLGDWLPNVDALITPGSTSSFEAEIVGVPVLFHEAIPLKERYTVLGVSSYFHLAELSQLKLADIEAARVLQAEKCIFERYVGKVDVDAVGAIVAAANEVLMQRCPLPVKPIENNPKRAKRFLLFNKITRAMYRIGMLEKLRWPRTAYRYYNDIPYTWRRNHRQQ